MIRIGLLVIVVAFGAIVASVVLADLQNGVLEMWPLPRLIGAFAALVSGILSEIMLGIEASKWVRAWLGK
jgi:hypothetical protein